MRKPSIGEQIRRAVRICCRRRTEPWRKRVRRVTIIIGSCTGIT